MSESLAIPLASVVRELEGELAGRHEVIEFAAGRCDSHPAQVQYVTPGEPERWQKKHLRELALDTVEEIGDAVAYIAAIIRQDPRRKEDWLTVLLMLSWAFDAVSDFGWEAVDAE